MQISGPGTRVRRSGGCSGFRQVSMRQVGSNNCSGSGPNPGDSLIPVPVTSITPVILQSQLLGVEGKNSRDLLVQTKNLYKSSGVFTVNASCNGNNVSNGDLWLTWADLIGTSGGGLGDSWWWATNVHTGSQLVIQINVAGTIQWTELGMWFSPAGLFTWGGGIPRPTATDEINITPAQWLGTGPPGNPQFWSTNWISSDGSIVRTVFWFGGKYVSSWEFTTVRQAATGWNTPYYVEMLVTGNDYSAPAFRYTYPIGVVVQTSGGSAKWFNNNVPTSIRAQGGFLSYPGGTSVVNGAPATQPISGQRFWDVARAVIVSGVGAGADGIWGFVPDEWWVGTTYNDGDTMGDNRDFIIFGQRVLQWGIGVPTMGVVGSTNYPTAEWQGRNTT